MLKGQLISTKIMKESGNVDVMYIKKKTRKINTAAKEPIKS